MNHSSYIPMNLMIQTVEQYIMISKGVRVSIKVPENDKQLQLLGLAYDIAASNMGTTFTYTFT
jgi:hypothetical protein